MAISLGELELKVKANIDEVKNDIDALNGESATVTVDVELDTSALQTFVEAPHTATVDVEANTEDAATSIDNVTDPAEGYEAEVDVNEGDDNVSGAIDTIENEDYNADVDIDTGDDNVSGDIQTIEDTEHSTDVDIEAGDDNVSDDIQTIENTDYSAEVDIDAGTDNVSDDISTIENDDYNAEVDIDTGSDNVSDDISTIETDEYSAEVDIDEGDDNVTTAINNIEDDEYGATVDIDADTTKAKENYNTFKDTVEKVKVVAKVVTTVIGVVTDPAEWADTVMTEAAKWGISNQQYQVLEYMTGELDVEMSNWELMYKNFFKQVKADASAEGEDNDAISAMKLLGINPDAFESEFDLMLASVKALQNYSGDDKDSIMSAIFGDRAQVAEIMNLLDDAGDKMDELEGRAYSSGYVKDDDTLNKLGSFQDALDKLSNTWTGLKNEIGSILAPQVQTALDAITPVLETLTGFLKDGKLDDAEASDLGTMLGNTLVTAVENALTVTGTIGSALITLLKNINWTEVLGGITKVVTEALEAFSDPEFLQEIGDSIENFITGISGFLSSPEFQTALNTIVGVIIPNLLTAIVEGLPGLLDAVINAADTLIPKLVVIVGDLIKIVSDKIPDIIKLIVDNLPTIINGIISAIPTLVKGIVDNIDIIVDAIIDITLAVISSLWNMFISLLKGEEKPKTLTIEKINTEDKLLTDIDERFDENGKWNGDLLSDLVEDLQDLYGYDFDTGYELIANALKGNDTNIVVQVKTTITQDAYGKVISEKTEYQAYENKAGADSSFSNATS